jgi:nitric oxide dioxygenase
MQTLSVVVKSLDKLDTIMPAIQALGRRHAGYGVRAEHYETVGVALLWTLERGLGEAFDEETRDAWTAAYGTLASVMIGAGEEPVSSYFDGDAATAAA